MSSTTFTVRVETDVKKRLEKLAKSTGRSRSFLAAEPISEYLNVNEWQVVGVRKAMASLDRGGSVPHDGARVAPRSCPRVLPACALASRIATTS